MKSKTNSLRRSTGSLSEEDDKEGRLMIYEGFWKNDLPNSEGVLYFAAESLFKYKGEFKDGKLHGKGAIYFDDKIIHQGEWFANLSHEFKISEAEWVNKISMMKIIIY